MVNIFEIEDTQHGKCSVCKGKRSSDKQVVQCSYSPCGKYIHVGCLPTDFDVTSLKSNEFYYCQKTCEVNHAPDRAYLEAKKNPQFATLISSFEAQLQSKTRQLEEYSSALETLNESHIELESKLKKTETELSQTILNSTRYNAFSGVEHESTRAGTSGTGCEPQGPRQPLDDSISHILDRVKQIRAGQTNVLPPSDVNPFSLNGSTLTEEDVTHAHALASITLSLSERRKQLPKLPEYSGKGAEWLHFRNTYRVLKSEGKYDNRELVAKLSLALKGKALDYTRLWLYSSHPNPDKIIQDLEDRFFSPTAIVTDAHEAILALPLIKSKDRNALENLRRAVDGYISVCTDVDDTPRLMIRVDEKVEDKLPDDLLERWIRLIRNTEVRGNWHNFSNFLKEATFDLKIRVSDRLKEETSKDSKGNKSNNQGSTASVNNVTAQSSQMRNFERQKLIGDSPICDYDSCGKPLYRCVGFATRPYDVKIGHCQLKGYCSRCLRKGHAAISCPNVVRLPKCKVEGCTERSSHTNTMHPPECDPRPAIMGNARLAVTNGDVHNCLFNNAAGISLFQVAKVFVEDIHGNQVPTTVFFDSGSNASLITQDFYRKLGLQGSNYNLMVNWCAAGVKQKSKGSFMTDLVISPAHDSSTKFDLKNLITMDNLQLPWQEQNESELHSLFPHLKDINIPEFPMQRPQILLGLHHRHLTMPLDFILPPSGSGSAIAERTKLGWVLSCANLPSFDLNAVHVPLNKPAAIEKPHECDVSLESINQLVKFHLNADLTSGVDRDSHYLTSDESRAIEILNRDMKLANGRYEVPLLWKSNDICLPDNSATALRRLISTEVALRKRNLVEWANRHHKSLLDAGFAREITPHELNPEKPLKRKNFVIGFVVINPKKPEKPRWVVDTAAKTNGISLNSALLKGPDNLIPLTQALCHFRERTVAVCADVEKQFHQIKIAKEDQYSQLYYWRDCDTSKDPKIYIFTSMLFGPTDSPTKANAVRIKHAQNSAEYFPNASRAALDSMYMDDLFISEDTISEAIDTSKQSIELFSQISWRLVDFRSNASEVLNSLPTSHLNLNAALELTKDDPTLMCCKVLGMFWNPKKDVFEFKQTAAMELRQRSIEENYHPTKLEILGFVMRIFDCLGLISPFIIRGRMIIQQTWKAQLDWHTNIPPEIFEAWLIWMHQFDEIAKLQIPRHYGYHSKKVTQIDLHVFTDASLNGYAAVGYFRFKFDNETVKIQQIMSKARVAPIKERTVPKLELDGAVVGARLAKVILDQHKRLTINSVTLWTDSEIVLRWIRGIHLRLLPYVAPRVSEIRDTFAIDMWRYCPSLENPSDHATKCTKLDFSNHCNPWYAGPEFLTLNPEFWPADRAAGKPTAEAQLLATKLTPNDEELYYAGIFEGIKSSTRADYDLYKRVVARCLRFTNNLYARLDCKSRNSSDIIEPEELEEAEKVILRKIQQAYWPNEINLLMGGKTLRTKHSKNLISLGAYIAPDGLLRCHSRFSRTPEIPFEMKCPIILPNTHETTDAIVSSIHNKNHHFGTEATVARLRSKYWIIATRQAVKRVIKKCTYCIFLRSRPYNIPTGDLPDIRVTPTTKPFQHSGADVFGPFKIYSGTSKHKRDVFVVIFTCLTSRAIYLRRLESLSSNEMMAAIQEVWTRRGPIQTMRSDNGRNFLGCANILTREFRQGLASQYGIKWIFIPAYTPQWGGAWERLIKDVKRAMKKALENRVVYQRVFDCILYQTEDIINSRPLTHVPACPDDDVPITPNLLIKLHPGYSFIDSKRIDEVSETDPRWFVKRAQEFSHKIATRWIKEYLPIIGKFSPTEGPVRDIKEGDFVTYCDPTTLPSKWQRGIVVKVYTGRDGLARVADIKLKDGTIVEKRSAYRLARLEIDSEPIHVNCNQLDVELINRFQVNYDSFISNVSRKFEHADVGHFNCTHTIDNINTPKYSFFVNIFHVMAQEALNYSLLKRFEVIELLKSIAREPLIPGKQDLSNSASNLALKLFKTANEREYKTNVESRIIKLSIDGGLITFMEVMLSLASLNCEPLWIKFQDCSQRAPIIAFILLRNSEDAVKLERLGKLRTSIGDLIISRPTTPRPMKLLDRSLEHALIQFKFRSGVWKVIVSRYQSDSEDQAKRRTNDPEMPRAAPLIGVTWMERYYATFDHEIYKDHVEWYDFRVEPPPSTIEFIRDDDIKPSERIINEISTRNRALIVENGNVKVQINATFINKTSASSRVHLAIENHFTGPRTNVLVDPTPMSNNISTVAIKMAKLSITPPQGFSIEPTTNNNDDVNTSTSPFLGSSCQLTPSRLNFNRTLLNPIAMSIPTEAQNNSFTPTRALKRTPVSADHKVNDGTKRKMPKPIQVKQEPVDDPMTSDNALLLHADEAEMAVLEEN